MNRGHLITNARNALDALQSGIDTGASRIAEQVAVTAEMLLNRERPSVVLTGTGKSGHVASALAGTLRSIGLEAHFLPVEELLHGDLGAVSASSVVLCVSKSGSGATLATLLDVLEERSVTVVGMTADRDSLLGRRAAQTIDVSVPGEADPAGILPTTSTLVALGAGLALAVVLMEARNITPDAFLANHPHGALGARLTRTVNDVMAPRSETAVVEPSASVRELVVLMTERPVGLALVETDGQELLGVVSDGDLRRALLQFENVLDQPVSAIMTRSPTVCTPSLLLAEALAVMERHRPRPISALPVLADDVPVGIVTLHQLREVVK